MEFLMTYGWAILIILVTVSVLFYLGVLNPQRVTPDSLTFPSGWSAYDYKIASNGQFYLDLGNGLGRQVTVDGVYCTNSATEPSNPGNVGMVIDSGDHKKVSEGAIVCEGASPGQYYKGKVYIWYTPVGSTVTYKTVGDIAFHVSP